MTITKAEAERLHLLIEECGEVIQAATKVLRHGYESCHPERPERTNRDDLRREIIDVRAVMHGMCKHDDIEFVTASDAHQRWGNKTCWTHHQLENLDA